MIHFLDIDVSRAMEQRTNKIQKKTQEDASVPEPPPKPHGIAVTPILLKWIDTADVSESVKTEAIALVKKRDAFGRAKYNQPLMTKDGRDDIEDAMQELGDLLQYIQKAKLNGKDTSALKKFVPLLQQLLSSRTRITKRRKIVTKKAKRIEL